MHIDRDGPVTIVAEIGINHNADVRIAWQLIRAAQHAGCDVVKFQMRTPRTCVPKSQWEVEKDTPWGRMSYIEYKEKMEFSVEEYQEINDFCAAMDISWFASPWDLPSLERLMQFEPPCIKVASASLTDTKLLSAIRDTGVPAIMSTGMSVLAQIDAAVEVLNPTVIMACTSTYPCPPSQLNLRTITAYQERYPNRIIGWSGHETGLAPTLAAVALGAKVVERHITLDRTMWGTDQSASIEPQGFERLVHDIRLIEEALGDGIKKVEPGEIEPMKKLRG